MTASTDDATRNGSMPISINRVNAPGASLVCERAENQVTGECCADRDVRRLAVSNLTHHHYVRILPQDVAQAGGKRQPDVGSHCNLVDALNFVLDRLLDRDDPLMHRVDRA